MKNYRCACRHIDVDECGWTGSLRDLVVIDANTYRGRERLALEKSCAELFASVGRLVILPNCVDPIDFAEEVEYCNSLPSNTPTQIAPMQDVIRLIVALGRVCEIVSRYREIVQRRS